jgi:hypothetical protein
MDSVMPHAVILDDLQCRHDAFRAQYGAEFDDIKGCYNIAEFDDIKHCYNMAEFLHHLLTYPGEIDLISLDHDLGDATKFGTGMDAVRLLCLLPETHLPRRINVHSHNYAKADEMMEILQRAGFSPTNTYFTEE